MKLHNFSIISNKKLLFSEGSASLIPENILNFGTRAILFLGSTSFQKTDHFEMLKKSLIGNNIEFKIFNISGEPDVSLIDNITNEVKPFNADCFIAIGGGSVMDSAKAVSAMCKETGSIFDFLEGVGSKKPSGDKIPLIAVPTTAGTGSEATFNAVIKGKKGESFKRSLRHENYTADLVIIDPVLYHGCPTRVAATSGLDAISQLIESFISTKSFLYSDVLILSAFEGMLDAFSIVTADKDEDFCENTCADAWKKMAYGAYISGFSLANAGLCVIHGIAGTIGGMFNAPHGALCGIILAEALRETIAKLEREDAESPFLLKLSTLGYAAAKSEDILPKEARQRLVQIIDNLTERLSIPRLSFYGIKKEDLISIAENSSNKNNPIVLNKEEILSILEKIF